MKVYQECIDFHLLKLKIENEPYLIEIVRFCAAFQSSATKWASFFLFSTTNNVYWIRFEAAFLFLSLHQRAFNFFGLNYSRAQQIHSLFFAINLIKHKKKIIFQMFLEAYGYMVYHCSAQHSKAPINVIFINKFLPKLEIG